MKNQKILHFCHKEKFIPDFIEFVGEHFDMNQHDFRVFGGDAKYSIPKLVNVKIANVNKLLKIKDYLFLMVAMCRAKKIIVHGLFNPMLIRILWAMPWLLKKCYWVMWGGDLYVHTLGERNNKWKRNEFFRRTVIKNMGVIVALIKGNYELAQVWYQTKASYMYSYIYVSNLYKAPTKIKAKRNYTQIMVGNSADSENNHIEIFEKIKLNCSGNYKVIVPLSYGDPLYAKRVIRSGLKLFGDKMYPLMDFMSYGEYMEVLQNTDIAIYNHKRSQGLGNITDLIGFGAKVYLRSDTTTWGFLLDNGVEVFDFLTIDNDLMSDFKSDCNAEKMREIFTKKKLIEQWALVFSEQ